MGWWIVKQPNGLYARFSTVVDDFTHMNMTGDEAREESRREPGCGRWEADEGVLRADREARLYCLDDAEVGKPLARWRNALDTIRTIHGAARVAERAALAATNPEPETKENDR
jgi:hypothetical protein